MADGVGAGASVADGVGAGASAADGARDEGGGGQGRAGGGRLVVGSSNGRDRRERDGVEKGERRDKVEKRFNIKNNFLE
jgi:hypothetical protein